MNISTVATGFKKLPNKSPNLVTLTVRYLSQLRDDKPFLLRDCLTRDDDVAKKPEFFIFWEPCYKIVCNIFTPCFGVIRISKQATIFKFQVIPITELGRLLKIFHISCCHTCAYLHPKDFCLVSDSGG